jgi:DNA-binding transcriptional ArsR family regulator
VATIEQLAAVFDGVGHPIRLRVLIALRGRRDLSPKQLSVTLREPLGNVAYHVRKMNDSGLITETRQEPVRGALAHFYKLTPAGRKLLRSAEKLLD